MQAVLVGPSEVLIIVIVTAVAVFLITRKRGGK
jgi:hypothetical protein